MTTICFIAEGVLGVFFIISAAISSVPTAHASELLAYFKSPELPGTSTAFPGAYELLSASFSLSSQVTIGQGIKSVITPGKVSESLLSLAISMHRYYYDSI